MTLKVARKAMIYLIEPRIFGLGLLFQITRDVQLYLGTLTKVSLCSSSMHSERFESKLQFIHQPNKRLILVPSCQKRVDVHPTGCDIPLTDPYRDFSGKQLFELGTHCS